MTAGERRVYGYAEQRADDSRREAQDVRDHLNHARASDTAPFRLSPNPSMAALTRRARSPSRFRLRRGRSTRKYP